MECGILSALPLERAERISPYIAVRSEQLPALDAMPGSLREREKEIVKTTKNVEREIVLLKH